MLRSVSQPPKQRLTKLLLLKVRKQFSVASQRLWQPWQQQKKKGDMTGMCPPSKLGLFYEFLSFSHLTPRLQCQHFFT